MEGENISVRYLVKKPLAPQGLTSAAQNVLFQCLDKIRRLDSSAARAWALRNIPSSIREALLHQVLSWDEYTIVKFWSMLYSNQLYHIYIPYDLSEKSRQTLMHYLGEAETKNINETIAKTLIFKVAGTANNPTELQMERIFLQKATYLTVFVHRKGASNDILEILGKCCSHLKEINVTGSTKVSDEGITKLFGYQSLDQASQTLNPVSKSLHFMKMRSTGVRVIGVRTLLHCAKNLQGVRCSSYDVLQALATQLKFLLNNGVEQDRKMSLKYLDFSNCFAILSKYLFLLPNLLEVRIGSDAPPQMRQTTKRLLVDDSQSVDDANFTAVLQALPQMHALQTLVLKAFDQKGLVPLLKEVGHRLRRLDLHYNYRYPGINLLDIGRYCPFLSDLALCDSLISTDNDPPNGSGKLFQNLTSLKLLRVTYSQPDDWECVVKMAKNLKILHMESSRSMSDSTIQSILSDNPLCFLEEFLVTGSGNRLSAKTVVRLTSQCSNLKWIGDLRDWNINERERTTFLPNLLSPQGWNSAKREPKEDSSPQEEGVMHFLSLSDTFDILSSGQ